VYPAPQSREAVIASSFIFLHLRFAIAVAVVVGHQCATVTNLGAYGNISEMERAPCGALNCTPDLWETDCVYSEAVTTSLVFVDLPSSSRRARRASVRHYHERKRLQEQHIIYAILV
jgi:hypothetical protein